MKFQSIVEAELGTLGLLLSPAALEALACYVAELERWSEKMNLTALRGVELIRRLILEPVWIGEKAGISGVLLDIGSGNGSPGIPLHIARQPERTFLVESRSKRSAFLRHVCYAANLKQIEVICDRFENVFSMPSVPANWISLQGVAFNRDLFQVMKSLPHEKTNILWITSAAVESFPVEPKVRITVPFTNTVAHIFEY